MVNCMLLTILWIFWFKRKAQGGAITLTAVTVRIAPLFNANSQFWDTCNRNLLRDQSLHFAENWNHYKRSCLEFFSGNDEEIYLRMYPMDQLFCDIEYGIKDTIWIKEITCIDTLLYWFTPSDMNFITIMIQSKMILANILSQKSWSLGTFLSLVRFSQNQGMKDSFLLWYCNFHLLNLDLWS